MVTLLKVVVMAEEEKVWCRIIFREREDGDGFEIAIVGSDCDKLFKAQSPTYYGRF